MNPLHESTASGAVALLRGGAIAAEALVRSCLDRIDAAAVRVAAVRGREPARP